MRATLYFLFMQCRIPKVSPSNADGKLQCFHKLTGKDSKLTRGN